MATFSLSSIYLPQFVSNTAAALTFAPAGGTTVPPNFNYLIQVARVSNVTASPATLQVWRVPSGASNDAQHLVIPSITIPAASQTFPWLDLGTLWGDVLKPGDAIWAVSGTASALVVHADGAVIIP